MRAVRCSGRRGGGACIPASIGQECVFPSMHRVGGVSQHPLGRGVSAREGAGSCLPGGGGGVCPGLAIFYLCMPRYGEAFEGIITVKNII